MMRRCTVCFHTYTKGGICPRCNSEKTVPVFDFNVSETEDVKVMYENFELDEILGLLAFKDSSGEWFVNVSTWVGAVQYAVVSVPLDKFKELICKIEAKEKE